MNIEGLFFIFSNRWMIVLWLARTISFVLGTVGEYSSLLLRYVVSDYNIVHLSIPNGSVL
jgi:hypothetical protein